MGLIFLTGMTASGKTTLGEKLAAKLRSPFVDLDARIARATGRKVIQIFAEGGEAAFREQEALALRRVVRMPDAVIALGAGALERQSNFELVHAHGILIYLRAPLDLLAQRLIDPSGRPMLAGVDNLEHLEHRLLDMLSQREPRYMTALIVVDTDGMTSAEDLVEKLCQALKPSA